MPEHTTNGVPSQALRDHVATLTDEGVDLLRRVVAFAAEALDVGADFDREVDAATLTEGQYQAAALLAGFRLWSLATAAHERLHGMTDEERAALLSMLAVRVTLTGASECPRCEGRGKLNGRRGGYRCDRCRGLRKLVDVRIEGEVVDDLGDALTADGRQGHLLPMPSALSYGKERDKTRWDGRGARGWGGRPR
ncbi:MAG: hypothetical protein QOI20_1837 [Acidimicrobiaceae bacterium]|jgi:hypothetical protein|nr:hypothetical protein [Acidimicrobiaceae bacterium]